MSYTIRSAQSYLFRSHLNLDGSEMANEQMTAWWLCMPRILLLQMLLNILQRNNLALYENCFNLRKIVCWVYLIQHQHAYITITNVNSEIAPQKCFVAQYFRINFPLVGNDIMWLHFDLLLTSRFKGSRLWSQLTFTIWIPNCCGTHCSEVWALACVYVKIIFRDLIL